MMHIIVVCRDVLPKSPVRQFEERRPRELILGPLELINCLFNVKLVHDFKSTEMFRKRPRILISPVLENAWRRVVSSRPMSVFDRSLHPHQNRVFEDFEKP